VYHYKNQQPVLYEHCLICCLVTLDPCNKILKYLLFKDTLPLKPTFKSFNLTHSDIQLELLIKELKTLINSSSIRQVAAELIQPIVIKRNLSLGKVNNIKFLKQYLKKYKYIYNRYFENQNKDKKITDKEVTTIAIYMLFLIAGI
jgi:hypothetical protein